MRPLGSECQKMHAPVTTILHLGSLQRDVSALVSETELGLKLLGVLEAYALMVFALHLRV